MDNDFLSGIILSYNKILKEMKNIKELREIKNNDKTKNIPVLQSTDKLSGNISKKVLKDKKIKPLTNKKKINDTSNTYKINLKYRKIRKSSKKEKTSVPIKNITLTNCDFFRNIGNDEF